MKREGGRIHGRRYRNRHPGRRAAYFRAYRVAHREERQQAAAAWVREHPAESRARRRAGRARHVEEWRARYTAWAAKHPEYLAAKQSRRKAMQMEVPGDHTIEEWAACIAEFGGRCAYCESATRLTRDHVIPLIAGGSHAIENIVPACLPCNSSKGRRYLSDWLGFAA